MIYTSTEAIFWDLQEGLIAKLRAAGVDVVRRDHPDDALIPLGPRPKTEPRKRGAPPGRALPKLDGLN